MWLAEFTTARSGLLQLAPVCYSSLRFATAHSSSQQLAPVCYSSLQFATARSSSQQLTPVCNSSLRFATACSGLLQLAQVRFSFYNCFYSLRKLLAIFFLSWSRGKEAGNKWATTAGSYPNKWPLHSVNWPPFALPNIYWIQSRYMYNLYIYLQYIIKHIL